jgi:hypothetical protein
MALTTTYIVVPFLIGARGALHPGSPRKTAVRGTAIAMADSLAPFYAGVIVLRDRADAAAGVFLEPLLVCAIGDVPSELLCQLAA